jgi:hypothetical protein
LVFFGAVAAVIAVASAPTMGQAQRAGGRTSWTQPRTPWGDPDLQGTWRNLSRLPLERAKGAPEFLTDEEIAAKQKEQAERVARAAAGELELAAERGLPLRNAVWYVPTKDMTQFSKRTSAIIDPPDGRLPAWTPQQVKRWEAREAAKAGRGQADSWEDRSPVERCIGVVDTPAIGYYGLGRAPSEVMRVDADEFKGSSEDRDIIGFGEVPAGGVGSRIVQGPGFVIIVTEGNDQSEYRLIPLDRRPQLPAKIRQFNGDARGHWEGNTLVVEITNMNAYQDGGRYIPSQTTTLYPGSGLTLTLTERYTRVSADTIEYSYTVNDPDTYVRPYTVLRDWTRDDSFAMAPGVCHENNDGLAGILASARADEAWALKYAEAEAQNRVRRLEEIKTELAASKTGSR